MSPSIPSPTPINGLRNPDGSLAPPGQRVAIEDFRTNDFAFALYAQALLAWQRDGNEDKDADSVTGTSYFQVTGVHGVPYVPWQDDPTKFVNNKVGYCTHGTPLFVPWHRPYLMLYEQMIYLYACEIVENSTGYAKEAYEAALNDVRVPFWDFNLGPGLPPTVCTTTLDINVPGDSSGQINSITLDHNPFYSYEYTSEYAWNLLVDLLRWKEKKFDYNNWKRETKRCPDFQGETRLQIANTQLVKKCEKFKEEAHSLLTSVHDFNEFTTTAYKKNKGSNYGAIESWHNVVHNNAGSDDTPKGGEDFEYYPYGNLVETQASSFDSLFWSLHCHIDRLTAIWQAMNYENIVIDELPNTYGRSTVGGGVMEGGAATMEPWHTSTDHNMNDYWIADSTKTVESTFNAGYYYPETPLVLRDNPEALKRYAIQQVNSMYADKSVVDLMSGWKSAKKLAASFGEAPSGEADAGFNDAAPDESEEPAIPNDQAVKPVTSVEWRVFVRVKAIAVQGTWGIHIFLGEPPAQSAEWHLADNNVGTITILRASGLETCSNCANQAARDHLDTGVVLISSDLRKRNIPLDNRNQVVEYLKNNLTWRIAKDAKNVEIEPNMGLLVGVGARQVAYPFDPTELPTWGPVEIYPAATRGKAGGMQENVDLPAQ